MAMAGGNGVIYLKLENKGGSADTLLKVESQAADAAEIHESSIGENDVMRMGFLSKVEVPPGETISLEPGGKHIMLVKLKQALELGHKIKLTLTFEKSGPLTIEAGIHQARVSAGHSLNHGEDK